MPFMNSAFGDFGSGVQDLFAASVRAKAQGNLIEAGNYELVAKYAEQESAFTKESTAIQTMQAKRELYKSMGSTTAGVAGAGFGNGDSAIGMRRESAPQRALCGRQSSNGNASSPSRAMRSRPRATR